MSPASQLCQINCARLDWLPIGTEAKRTTLISLLGNDGNDPWPIFDSFLRRLANNNLGDVHEKKHENHLLEFEFWLILTGRPTKIPALITNSFNNYLASIFTLLYCNKKCNKAFTKKENK